MSAIAVAQKGQLMPVTVVPDEQQQIDHNGQPIAPLTPAGLPYRYRLRRPGSAVYAATADDLLGVVIDGYPAEPAQDADPAAVQAWDQQTHDLRVLHAFGVITTLVADAIISGQLTADQEHILQRSAERGPGAPPITAADCPRWEVDSVPMVLIEPLYDPSLGDRVPPAGNVVFIDPGVPDRYLRDLARLGLIELSSNPIYREGGLAELIIPDCPED